MGAIAPWLIPLAVQAVGTGIGYSQRGTRVPRIDTSALNKALKLASQMPSPSTVMQRGRRELGAQAGYMRSAITRVGRDVNIKPGALQEISEGMVSPIMSKYIQGMGRTYGRAIQAGEARTRAVTGAASALAGVEGTNIQLGLQEEAMRPNPLEMGAGFGQLAGNIMQIQSMNQYIEMINNIFGGGTPRIA